MKITGRSIAGGTACGPLLSTTEPISFLGMIDPKTGTVTDTSHPLYGKSVAGTVLAFPKGKGSTVGSYIIYALKCNGTAPAACIVETCETIVAVGAIIAGIPVVDTVSPGFAADGTMVSVDGTAGTVEFT